MNRRLPAWVATITAAVRRWLLALNPMAWPPKLCPTASTGSPG
ncbi:hypothetical protein [Corallococcus sp. 4LFB]